MFKNLVDIIFLMKYEEPRSFRYVKYSEDAMFLASLKHTDLNKRIEDVYDETVAKELNTRYMKVIETGSPVSYVDRMNIADRSKQYAESVLIPIYTPEHTYIIGLTKNITKYYNLEHYQSTTGMLRFSRFKQLLEEMRQGNSGDDTLVLYTVQINEFKDIKAITGDSFHQVLLTFVSRFQMIVNENDLITRNDGDEFVIARWTKKDKVLAYAQKIIETLSTPIDIDMHRITTIGISVGIAIDQNEEKKSELIHQSYKAMLSSKQKGMNSIEIYDEAVSELFSNKMSFEFEVRKAIKEGEFELHYQPKINLHNHSVHLEALIRWNHPVMGFLPPMRFIPLAESSSLIIDIGNWVVQEVCKKSKEIKQLGFDSISINISPQHLKESGAVDVLANIIKQHGVDPGFIDVEITEQVFVNFKENPISFKQIKDCGFSLTLDDFGVHYSSLGYIKNLPIDRIKIDRSFITRILDDRKEQEIVKMIISLANVLDLKVTAEGVETEAQLNVLQQLGCQEFQGFYFSKPKPLALLEKASQYLDKFAL